MYLFFGITITKQLDYVSGDMTRNLVQNQKKKKKKAIVTNMHTLRALYYVFMRSPSSENFIYIYI